MTIKQPKYLYFIIVELNGEEILKFGISNKYERRFKEYRNSETIGYFKKVLCVYRTREAKKIETVLKWYMKQKCKPILKQEYFPLEYYDLLINTAESMCKEFAWVYKKIDTDNLVIKRNKGRRG